MLVGFLITGLSERVTRPISIQLDLEYKHMKKYLVCFLSIATISEVLVRIVILINLQCSLSFIPII